MIIKSLILILGVVAYILIESKYKKISYIIWATSNIYWAYIASNKNENVLALMLIIYSGFSLYHLFNLIKRDNEENEKKIN